MAAEPLDRLAVEDFECLRHCLKLGGLLHRPLEQPQLRLILMQSIVRRVLVHPLLIVSTADPRRPDLVDDLEAKTTACGLDGGAKAAGPGPKLLQLKQW